MELIAYDYYSLLNSGIDWESKIMEISKLGLWSPWRE